MSATTRELIRKFNAAFDRPVNNSWTQLTVTERELLGKLLLEETLEYVTKGLGLEITWVPEGENPFYLQPDDIQLGATQLVDPVECVDGLADVNVVAHFAAHWHGFNLDRATEIVNESNMSKLGDDGKPIINGVTPDSTGGGPIIDPSKPIGKILKSPNFVDPATRLRELLMTENNNAE